MKALLLSSLLCTLASPAFAEETDPATAVAATNASLTVEGKPGAGQQKSQLSMVPLSYTPAGALLKGTMPDRNKYAQSLNKEVPLAAGEYLVNYSGSLAIVDIAAGERKVIKLSTLTVPKADGKSKFQVFQDLTVADEQNKFLVDDWIIPKTLTFQYQTDEDSWSETVTQDTLCTSGRGLKSLEKAFCAVYMQGDYRAENGAAIQFNKDASFSGLAVSWSRDSGAVATEVSEKWLNEGRLVFASGTDGQSVSLLPGTYGLRVTNAAGKATDKYGVTLTGE